jgi:hypothetical protein
MKHIILLCGLLLIPVTAFAQVPAGYQAYTTPDTLVSLVYPDGWTVSQAEDGSLNLSNNAAAFETTDLENFALQSGDVGVSILFVPTEYASLLGVSGTNLEERIAGLAALLTPGADAENPSPMTVGEIEILDGDVPMGRVTYQNGTVSDGMVAVWEVAEDLLGVATVTAYPGELGASEESILTILRSVEFHSTIDEILAGLE